MERENPELIAAEKDFEKEQFRAEIDRLRSELSKAHEEITYLKKKNNHDFLTGLYNREFFQQQVGKKIEQINKPSLDERREGSGPKNITAIFIDLDNFKWINDEFGHEIGDRVLKEAAEALKSNIRSDKDIAARLGGEEFVVVMSDATEEAAKKKAEYLLEQISRRTKMQTGGDVSDAFISAEASIGVAEFQKGENLSDFISRSDKAMYAAKESGKNRVVSFSEIPERENENN